MTLDDAAECLVMASHTEHGGEYVLPDGMDLGEQVGVLAQFIVENFPEEPSQSGGAIETAIRLMKDLLTWKVVLEQGKEMAFEAMNRERRYASEHLAEVYALRSEVERLTVLFGSSSEQVQP